MSDTERAYSLYVQANPVPDPGRLPETPHEAELLMIERSRTMDTQQRPASRETKRPPRWRTAVIAFAAIIVVVGATIGIATLITNDNDTAATPDTVQTLTFDGAEPSPTAVPRRCRPAAKSPSPSRIPPTKRSSSTGEGCVMKT